MSENALMLQLVNLFTTDDTLEVLVAECMNRMTDFHGLCEEKTRQEHGQIDSDLELTSPQARRLDAIHQSLLTYPVELNPARTTAVDATVGMLVCDREVPFFVFENLREVLNRLVAKNGLILTAEPNAPAATYVSEDGVMLNSEALGDLTPRAYEGSGQAQQMAVRAPEGTVLDADQFTKPIAESYLKHYGIDQLQPFPDPGHGSRAAMFYSQKPADTDVSERLQALSEAAGSMTGISDTSSKVEED